MLKSCLVLSIVALFSTTANAYMPVDDFLSILPYGDYVGQSPNKNIKCYITVQPKFLSEGVFVAVTEGNKTKNITVDNFSVTKYNEKNQDFRLSKEIWMGQNGIINSIRTFRASNGHLYVATAYGLGVSEITKKEMAECVLKP